MNESSPSVAAPHPDEVAGDQALSAVSETLRIPLAARALGAKLFPALAVDDAHAALALDRLGDDGQRWLRDRHSIYGVLSRTLILRELATAFLARHPQAHIVNLGCGLSDYFQWLDNGQARMTDADLPAVLALRQRLLPPPGPRQQLKALDLTSPDWWEQAGLPTKGDGAPLFLMAEGVFMYLHKAEVQAVFTTFAERAPAGSQLAFDAMCWLAAGRAGLHRSVSQTDAQFHWGPRKEAELSNLHPRLRRIATHRVIESYGLPYSLLGPLFRALLGVPFYALYLLGVNGPTE